MNRKIEILCTLGPSSVKARIIRKLDNMGVDVFRINLSHTDENDIEKAIINIRKATCKPICLDTEGAQVRNGQMIKEEVYFAEGAAVKIHAEEIIGDSSNLYLRPSLILGQLAPGDLISIDFDTLLLKVTRTEEHFIETRVICGGYVGNNKAVTIDKDIELPVLSEKDLQAVETGLYHGIKHIALSFAGSKEDVDQLRELVGRDVHIISKIESKKGVENLSSILSASDSILIDRGDLSREVLLEKIPFLQKQIIRQANRKGVPVYVATNLLESMVRTRTPTRAEINDIANTLLDGADGLVLAAETAVGAYPLQCVNMVKRMIKSYHASLADRRCVSIPDSIAGTFLGLVEPHGGNLVNCRNYGRDKAGLSKMPRLMVNERVLIDAQQIAIGTYSPLDGFMKRDEIDCVLNEYKLPSGTVWTLPIVLQLPEDKLKNIRIGDEVALVAETDGCVYAVLRLEDLYQFNFKDVAESWYGTEDLTHPGVRMLRNNGSYFLGGKVELVRRFGNNFSEFTLTPLQTRHIFEKKGWNTVVGFHTRNVIHRAHEHIQLTALKELDIDGLFVHPIIGPKKEFDYKPEMIMKSYMLMTEKYYPKDKVLLGAFSSYSRYAGPREAIFTALCRKNFGCTHFIVGRDHTGIGDFYQRDDAKKLFEQIGNIGIQPIFFDEVYYSKASESYVESAVADENDALRISGTEAREMLNSGKFPPQWFMRRDIAELILNEINSGNEVFIK